MLHSSMTERGYNCEFCLLYGIPPSYKWTARRDGLLLSGSDALDMRRKV
jgi:hypothetical protein